VELSVKLAWALDKGCFLWLAMPRDRDLRAAGVSLVAPSQPRSLFWVQKATLALTSVWL
jgi:hypothetical protein